MNVHIILGLFALYAAAISLYLVLSGRQDAVLALFRRFWGRTLGHSLYFMAHVALPLLVCVLCLGWGVRQYDATVALHSPDMSLQLNVETYRDQMLLLQKDQTPDSLGVVYGA
ncbi:MAG: hypothetical protein DRH08_14495 [Deltaproteobacteria bacterium]|nr:MAG: hypothetical protein DRH08_14495 [Deltaproteobacteria bacterium]